MPATPFPATRHSVLRALHSADAGQRSHALAAVVDGYWRPACAYLRMRWGLSLEDAEDATQSFFTRTLTSGLLERYDPSKARFRTYLRVCLDGQVANERAAERRLKRGGGAALVPLEVLDIESEAGEATVDAWFEQEWVRALCADTLAELREQLGRRGRGVVFTVFERYDVSGADAEHRPTYAALAQELGVPATQVTNYLAAARREFRALVLDRLRRLTTSEDEFRAEARALLGVDPP